MMMMHRSTKMMAKALLMLAASAAVAVDHDNSLSNASNPHALKLQLSLVAANYGKQNPLDAVKGFFGLFGGNRNKNIQKKDTHIEDMKEIFGTAEDEMGSSAAFATPSPASPTYRSPFEVTRVPDVVYVGHAPSTVKARSTGYELERNVLLDERKFRSVLPPAGTPPGTPPFSPPASPTPSEVGSVAAYVPEAEPSPMNKGFSLRGAAGTLAQAERLDQKRETIRAREGERAIASPVCARAEPPKRTNSWFRRQSQQTMKKNRALAQQAAQAHNRYACPTFTPAKAMPVSERKRQVDRAAAGAQVQSKKPVSSNAALHGSQEQKQNTYRPTNLASMAPKQGRAEAFTSAFYCDPKTGRVIGSSTTITQGSRKFEVNMYNGHTWTNKPRR